MIEMDVKSRKGEFQLDVQLTMSGRVCAIFGPSGSGKTTLVRMIAGLETPQEGSISIAGEVVFDVEKNINLTPRQRRVGVVYQNANLFPHFNVRRNLEYSIWAGRRKSRLLLDKVSEVLGIGHLLERRPLTLSGGEMQRVALGRALLSGPSILLMDEPLSALDIKRKLEILSFLEKIRDGFDIPMIYVSHSVDEVTRLADHLVILDEGQVTATGAIETVLAQVNILGSGEQLEAGNLLFGRCVEYDEAHGLAKIDVEGQVVFLSAAGMETGRQVRLRVKAGDVALALVKPTGTSIQNMLKCVVQEIELSGFSHAELTLALGNQRMRSRITRKAVSDLELASGDNCIALLKAVALENLSS